MTDWILTALFAVIGGWHLATAAAVLRTRGRSGWRPVVDALLHASMSAAMLAMLWPWQDRLPVALEAGIFTLAAGWFVVTRGSAGLAGWYDAAAMAAMVWMLVSMPAEMVMDTEMSAAMSHHAGASMMSHADPARPASVWVSLALAGLFALGAGWQLSRVVAGRDHPAAVGAPSAVELVETTSPSSGSLGIPRAHERLSGLIGTLTAIGRAVCLAPL